MTTPAPEQTPRADHYRKEFKRRKETSDLIEWILDELAGVERELAALRASSHPALHASAPEGHLCADCTMDKEPCPTCYSAWWSKSHPNLSQV